MPLHTAHLRYAKPVVASSELEEATTERAGRTRRTVALPRPGG